MRGVEIPGLTYLWVSLVEDVVIWDTMSEELVETEDDLAESDIIGDIQNG
jgi:hypothetical protein